MMRFAFCMFVLLYQKILLHGILMCGTVYSARTGFLRIYMHAIKNYFQESFQELRRVTWPTKNRAVNICILVVVFVLISATVVAAIDFVFNRGYSYLLTVSR